MKKMKFLLGAVAAIASLSAFTIPVKLVCPGAYIYQGTTNPESDQNNASFIPSDEADCSTEADFFCLWNKVGENQYEPCSESTVKGKYVPSAKAQISR